MILFWGAVLNVCTLILGWQRRNKPGGWSFVGLMAACVVWTASASIESAVTGAGLKIFWSQMEYIGLVFVGEAFLFFALAYTHQTQLLGRGLRLLLVVLSVAALTLVWTNHWHHAQWTGFSAGPPGKNVLVYHRGPVFWFIIAYTYVLALFGFGVFANACRSAGKEIRRQYVAFMFSGLFPLATGIVYIVGQKWVDGIDVSPMGFSIAGLIIAWDLSHYQLLDLVPISREVLVEWMPDGMIVFDDTGRQIDINPAARRLLGLGADPIELDAFWRRFPALAWLSKNKSGKDIEAEGVLPGADGPHHVHIRVVPLRHIHGQLRGRLCVLTDITARVLSERVLAEQNPAQAKDAILQELLPICCSCKKIRDEHGVWQQVETFLRERAGMQFSHSLCSDCAKKLYGSSEVQE